MSGILTESSEQLLAEWLNTWIKDYIKNSLRPTTCESYLTQINKHIKPIGTHKIDPTPDRPPAKTYTDKLTGRRAVSLVRKYENPKTHNYCQILNRIYYKKKMGKLILGGKSMKNDA